MWDEHFEKNYSSFLDFTHNYLDLINTIKQTGH